MHHLWFVLLLFISGWAAPGGDLGGDSAEDGAFVASGGMADGAIAEGNTAAGIVNLSRDRQNPEF